MWRQIRTNLRQFKKVVVAVSGGADSMFALDFCIRAGLDVTVVHFNHKIRDNSDNDEAFVREYCANHNLYPNYTGYGQDIKNENDARTQRYAFLMNVMTEVDAERIVTGHHLNDQIETVFLRLTRGYPHDALTMKEDNGSVYRPFLKVEKDIIIAQCKARNIPWVEDETNAGLDYERNRIRNTVIPELMKTRNIVKAMAPHL